MTDEEIRTSYRDAANKKEQLTVLSELTLRPIRELREVLGLDTPPAPAPSTEPTTFEKMNKAFDEDKAKALYNDGWNDEQIADAMQYGKTWISRWRREAGLPTQTERSKLMAPKLDGEKLQADYDKGMLDSEMAKKHGVKTADVADWRQGLDLTRNSRKREPVPQRKVEKEVLAMLKEEAQPKPAEAKPAVINRPPHYVGADGMEVEDVLRQFIPRYKDGYVAHRVSAALEYLLRAPAKNGTEDIKKARRVLDMAIEYLETNHDII